MFIALFLQRNLIPRMDGDVGRSGRMEAGEHLHNVYNSDLAHCTVRRSGDFLVWIAFVFFVSFI